jgi:DNA topoisomerase-1
MSTLIIVESPAKAKKIGQLLGKDYIVKASVGHIYELSKIEENFEPSYELIKGKSKVLKELKDTMKTVANVILAGDADREGEAISWSVAHALKLSVETCPRIVFHEITKNALEEAVKNPGVLSMDLINAQKARAVLDRLVGFEISPILWKQIAPSLSAGRVQTPLLHLIMEREKEIEKFKTESYFDTYSEMYCESPEMKFVGLLDKKFSELDDVKKFMSDIYPGAVFTIADVKKGTKTKKPSAPFTTATLLQDAAGKCRMSSKQIMMSAQKLYECGKITYHRTDSTNLSKDILAQIKRYTVANYGEIYVKLRNYKTKVKNSQEAHEAIRPTHIDQDSLIDGSFEPNDKKLYQLIWKRTMASQLAEATFATITVSIGNDRRDELFIAYGENCTFDGFLRVYHYEEDDNREEDPDKIPDTPYEILSKLEPGKVCKWNDIYSEEKVKQGPGHYSESQLIKKMQDTGIGRPSTYSSMMNKLIDRGYVVKENRDMGKARVHQLRMTSNGKQKETSKEIVLKKEFSKLFPTDTGKITDIFMDTNFNDLVRTEYTAGLEDRLDEVANGTKNWREVIANFYEGFHPKVLEFSAMKREVPREKSKYTRNLGKDPEGNDIIARMGPYGAIVQMGSKELGNVKYAMIEGGKTIESITVGEAIELLKYPRNFGMYNGLELILKKGKYGPYLEYNKKTYSLKNVGINLDEITREKSIEIITTSDGYIPKKKSD